MPSERSGFCTAAIPAFKPFSGSGTSRASFVLTATATTLAQESELRLYPVLRAGSTEFDRGERLLLAFQTCTHISAGNSDALCSCILGRSESGRQRGERTPDRGRVLADGFCGAGLPSGYEILSLENCASGFRALVHLSVSLVADETAGCDEPVLSAFID